MEALSAYIDLARKNFGSRFLYLDGGDQFPGTLENDLNQDGPIVDALNTMGLTAGGIDRVEYRVNKSISSFGMFINRKS